MKQYSVTLWLRVSALKQHDVYRLCSRLSGSRLNDVIVNRILTSRPWPMMKIMAVTSGRDVSSCNKRIKLAVVGDKHVGKTSLISRYVYNSFSQHYTYTQGEWGTYVYIARARARACMCVRDCVCVCVCA